MTSDCLVSPRAQSRLDEPEAYLIDQAGGRHVDLKFELERITGRSVDLVDASAVRTPYFKAALGSGWELYAA